MGASWSALGVLRGASGTPKGASRTSRGGSWELQGRPLKRLGVLRGCLREALGSFCELRGRIGSKHVENTEFFLSFSMVFEAPGSLKSTKKLSKRQQKRLGGLFLRLGGLLLSKRASVEHVGG